MSRFAKTVLSLVGSLLLFGAAGAEAQNIQAGQNPVSGTIYHTGGNVGIGTSATGINSMTNTLTVFNPNDRGMLELVTGAGDVSGLGAGQLGFFTIANVNGSKQVAAIARGSSTTAARTTATRPWCASAERRRSPRNRKTSRLPRGRARNCR
jgi:hypothetical protein